MVESEGCPTHYDVHNICKKLKISAPKLDLIFEELEKRGYSAVKTHFNPLGIKTDASLAEIKKIIIFLNEMK